MEPAFVKEILLKLKSHIEYHTIIVGDFNTQLLPMNRHFRQKHSREIKQLIDVMAQMILTYLQIIFYKHKIYLHLTELFSKTEHVLNHKASLKRYKIIARTTCIFSDHHGLKLDFDNRNNRKQQTTKTLPTQKLTNSQQNSYSVKAETNYPQEPIYS